MGDCTVTVKFIGEIEELYYPRVGVGCSGMSINIGLWEEHQLCHNYGKVEVLDRKLRALFILFVTMPELAMKS